MEEDKENGYKWLYGTPIEENVVDYNIVSEGDYKYTGPILRFYTSIGPSAIAPLVKFFIESDQVREEMMKLEEQQEKIRENKKTITR